MWLILINKLGGDAAWFYQTILDNENLTSMEIINKLVEKYFNDETKVGAAEELRIFIKNKVECG